MEARKRKGPLPKMQAMERQALRDLILEHPLSTAGELVKLLRARTGTSVSVPTLVKAIKAEGIVRVKPATVSGYAQPTPEGPPRYGYNERHRDEGDHQRYATSLTQAEWDMVADIFDDAGERGRPAVHARRAIVDACFYVVRTGCSWRLMPKTFPPWNAVYKLFRRWSRQGRFERMHDRLRLRWRERAERDEFPSTAILDSQSTRTSPQGGEKGFDAGKRVKGRKRNLVVDTLGLVLAVVVTAASVQDRDGISGDGTGMCEVSDDQSCIRGQRLCWKVCRTTRSQPRYRRTGGASPGKSQRWALAIRAVAVVRCADEGVCSAAETLDR